MALPSIHLAKRGGLDNLTITFQSIRATNKSLVRFLWDPNKFGLYFVFAISSGSREDH